MAPEINGQLRGRRRRRRQERGSREGRRRAFADATTGAGGDAFA
jgi:hypothetical protein